MQWESNQVRKLNHVESESWVESNQKQEQRENTHAGDGDPVG